MVDGRELANRLVERAAKLETETGTRPTRALVTRAGLEALARLATHPVESDPPTRRIYLVVYGMRVDEAFILPEQEPVVWAEYT